MKFLIAALTSAVVLGTGQLAVRAQQPTTDHRSPDQKASTTAADGEVRLQGCLTRGDGAVPPDATGATGNPASATEARGERFVLRTGTRAGSEGTGTDVYHLTSAAGARISLSEHEAQQVEVRGRLAGSEGGDGARRRSQPKRAGELQDDTAGDGQKTVLVTSVRVLSQTCTTP